MTNELAHKGMTFAIFCALKVDVRLCNLKKTEAQTLLDYANDSDTGKRLARTMALALPGALDKLKAGATLASGTAKPATSGRSKAETFRAIYNEARAAGLKAGNECVPVPMIVRQHANPLDDSSPVVRQYAPVMDGACGFAWVNIRPATSAFAKWLKAEGLARAAYQGGIDVWIGDHDQSLTRKEAHAGAFAGVLAKHGFTAYSQSRMD